MRLRQALAAGCAVAVYGCMRSGAPLPTLLPENFPPYGIAFERYEAPEFPYQLRATPIASGYSVVVVTIDAVGRVEDAVAIEASDPAFGRAVIDVTPAWIFAPIESETQTEPRREVLHYRFHRSGVVSSLSHREGARALFIESSDDFARVRMVAWEDLDEAPVRLDTEGSGPGAGRRPIEGNADLSFVIDETGAVRVPTVVAATDYAIGIAAVDAIKEWKFTPPRSRGEPVLVEVRARWGD